MPIIEAEGLKKTYKTQKSVVKALDGLDLMVEQGKVKALLGPNGAGKTTTVKVLTTLLTPDSGRAVVDGVDVLRDPDAVKSIIGASGQYAAVDENLTALENLDMIGRLYHLPAKVAKSRAKDLIEMFELTEAMNRPIKGFSGGMRRRIDLAGALVINPKILFLDEPTTGLDPRSRLALWDVIKELVSGGTTVLLTTQYLEEADQLADDISVIDTGKVIAEGTADELKAQVGGHRVEVTVVDPSDALDLRSILARHGNSEPVVADDGRSLHVQVQDGPRALGHVLADVNERDIELHDAGVRRPTLDDVFLTLTGHGAAQEETTSDASMKEPAA